MEGIQATLVQWLAHPLLHTAKSKLVPIECPDSPSSPSNQKAWCQLSDVSETIQLEGVTNRHKIITLAFQMVGQVTMTMRSHQDSWMTFWCLLQLYSPWSKNVADCPWSVAVLALHDCVWKRVEPFRHAHRVEHYEVTVCLALCSHQLNLWSWTNQLEIKQ